MTHFTLPILAFHLSVLVALSGCHPSVAGTPKKGPATLTPVAGIQIDQQRARPAPGFSSTQTRRGFLVTAAGAQVPQARVSCSRNCGDDLGRCAKHVDDDGGLSCEPECCSMLVSKLELDRAPDGVTDRYRVSGKRLTPKAGFELKPLAKYPGALAVTPVGGGAPEASPKAYCSCGEGYSTDGCHWIEQSDGSSECGGTKACCDVYVLNEVVATSPLP